MPKGRSGSETQTTPVSAESGRRWLARAVWLALLTSAFLAVAGMARADSSPVDEAVETVEDTVEPVVEDVIQTADEAVETVEDTVQPVVEDVTQTADEAVETVEDTVQPIVDDVIEKIDDVTDTVLPVADPGAPDRDDVPGRNDGPVGNPEPDGVRGRSPERAMSTPDLSGSWFMPPVPGSVTISAPEASGSSAGGATSPLGDPLIPANPLASSPASGLLWLTLAILAGGVFLGTPAGRWALPPPTVPSINSFALSVERPG